MKKGEIWNANLNPTKGSEQAGVRPVLIVSGNLLNEYAPVVWVCPITTKIKNYKGNIVLKPNKKNGLSKKSEVLNLHLRSVSNERLVKKIGTVARSELDLVRKGIQEVLLLD
jgi:mRNA interferase MazF